VIRTVLVVIHAGAGIAGLVAGFPSFALPRDRDGRSWVRWLYLACIAMMLVTLIALVVLDWEGLDTMARVAFTALTGLAAVMMLRIVLAARVVSSHEPGWEGRYIGHVYFTYISLWIGVRDPPPGPEPPDASSDGTGDRGRYPADRTDARGWLQASRDERAVNARQKHRAGEGSAPGGLA
jgi:hypothetical protein